ncbi:MAG: PEP-CTERM sorting domain-containing protein [Opitutales bacterium]|nr:PEP-CTERM sorting domain-containing protein [Opitutales bacterium]
MKKIILTTSLFALFTGAVMASEVKTLESQSNVEITQESSAHGSVAGSFKSQSVLMDGISYKDISVSLDSDDNAKTTQLHGGITRITDGTLTVNNTIFKDINMHSQYQVQGGAIYVNGVGAKAVITGSTFDSITSSVGDYTPPKPSDALPFAMGSAIINWQGDLSVSDTDFNNNKVVANKAEHSAEGGAIYLMMTGKPGTHHTEGEKVSFTNVKFTKNSAVSVANNNEHSAGGAIIVQGRYDGVYDSTRSLTFTDTVFQNNQAGWGGAIYSDTQSMTFNVSAGKELAYTGNKSLDGDNAGGFIYMDVHSPDGGATYKDVFATFNIAENAKLTIGDGTVGFDSIASSNNHATINKTGVGSLVVNSSMEYFTGTLNVNAGTMEANNGLGADKTFVKKGATLSVDGFVAENKTVLKTDNGNIEGGFINTKGTTTWDNATVKNNTVSISISNDNDKGIIGGGIARIDGGGEMTVNNAVVSDNNTSVSAKVDSAVHGSLFYAFSDAKLNINNSVFENNTASSTYNTQGGVVSANGKVSLNVNDSIFKNNIALQNGTASTVNPGFDTAQGGVANIFAVTGDVVFTNVTFEGNKAKSTDTTAMGGAAYIYNSNVTFNDVNISNNSANGKVSYSGAIHMTGTSEVTFNVVDKDGLFVGNYAGDSDENGGLMKLNKSTVKVNFNIADKKTLTVGNGTAGYDSIAGADGSTINKTGAGSVVVNSSMEYFTGTLNVNAGTMDANNGLGAKAVNIASGATLNVGLTSTSLTSATVVNDGILGLKRGTLADGDTLTISSYSGEGTVNAFGGSFANGVFTAGKSAEFTNNVITVGSAENDVQTVSFVGADNNKLVLDFNVSGKETMTVNNITEVSEAENIVGDFITGFSVDATYNGDLSVVLSAYVGDISNPANLVAWHKADGSNIWTKLDGEVEYDASTGFASIFVEGFSSYAFSQVPEPSTYAMIFGAIALGFVAYRRRK